VDADILKSIPLFADQTDEDLSAISTFAELVQVTEGKVLMQEGSFANDFLVIKEGTAEVTRGGETLAKLGPGDTAGEAGLIEKSPRNATVTATSPMTLVKLTQWELARMQKRLPHVLDRIKQTVEDRAG
jgi:CRP-like cAMP-binding protein